MSCTSGPTCNGTYRIQVYNNNTYLASDPGINPGLRLETLDTSNTKQRWILTNQGGSYWTLVSAFDNAGVVSFVSPDAYWGYGYPLPSNDGATPDTFNIYNEGNYSRIIRTDGTNHTFDSCDPGSNAVNYYYDKSDNPNQKYVFELIQAN